MKILSSRNDPAFPGTAENVPFKAYTPNGVARDKGKNPTQQSGQNEGTTSTGSEGWRGNRTGE